jgi:type IV secretion system protein VirB9
MKTLITSGFLTLVLIAAATQAAPRRAWDRRIHSSAISVTAMARPYGLHAVAAANGRALQEPNGSGFVNAAQVYAWSEGALYRLFTAPGLVSDVELQPGENLVSVAAGDTARWVIGDTTSGAGPGRRTHILVKPIASGLRTNLVITTDRRVYLLSVVSTSAQGMVAVSWTYPQDELLALKAAKEAALAAAPVAQDVAVDRLNFNYRIEGDQAPWRPVRAFDDGAQTFIEFPLSIRSGEIPPLFVIGSSGRAEIVNYRLSGRYFVVDRLFSVAELRLGEKRQLIVRIIRTGANRAARAE